MPNAVLKQSLNAQRILGSGVERMTKSNENSQYLHGTTPSEQERLSRLNELLNERSLQEMALRPG